MKKVLIVATVPSMIGQFNMNNISILLSLNYEVHVACDWNDRSVWTNEKVKNLKEQLGKLKVKCIQIDYSRTMFSLMDHYQSYRQTMKLLMENKYEFVHCHTPIASAIVRLVCKKTKIKCIYTAHGFHFFKGAPLKNWIIFYPIEKWLSKYTDILITINEEDYARAKFKFKMKQLEYVPGVGIDIKKYQLVDFDRSGYRKNLCYSNEDFVIISVGELSKRKNHEIVIEAIYKLHNLNIKYMIVGKGNLEERLNSKIIKYGLQNQVKILGFRTDIPELLKSSDLFVFPSLQEGLPVALMEAMATGMPCLVSNIRGNVDLIDNTIDVNKNVTFAPTDLCGFMDGIKRMYESPDLRKKIGSVNFEKSKKYDIKNIEKTMKDIYLKEK